MRGRLVYLDHAAASPMPIEVLNYVHDNVALFYNPSSYYSMGQYNGSVIEHVRQKIAKEINCSPEEIYFTSGASESNSMAIQSFYNKNKRNNPRIISTALEHSSILNNPRVEPCIPIDGEGAVVLKSFNDLKLRDCPVLCCVSHANSETGLIQDVKEIASRLYADTSLLVDAAQTFGKIKIDVQDIGCDYLSASAGKIGGLRGVGFLYVRKGQPIEPLIHGMQERGKRGGTYFDLGIGAFGKAISCIDYKHETLIRNRKLYLVRLLSEMKDVEIITNGPKSLAGHVLFRIKNTSLSSQQLVGLLDEAGFLVSSGSACHAAEDKPSHVLKAMGYPDEDIRCVLRITLGLDNTKEDIDSFVENLKNILYMNR